MSAFNIVPITEAHINGYQAALDNVVKERKCLSFLEAPSLEMKRSFVLENIREGWPHFVAIADGIIKSHRGKGIGEALMRAALQKAKDKGLTRVSLTVRGSNSNAIALYKKLGFVGGWRASECHQSRHAI